MAAFLCAVFFVSGASALIFETLWFRQAGLAFGNSIWASSLVLSAFMGGLALGNTLAARYGSRIRNPVRGYAVAEAAIALTGVGLVYLLPVFGTLLAPWIGPLLDQPWVLNPFRLVIAFLLLLIPSTAMGITLPLLTAALTARDPRFGLALGRLYGWNTLGAMAGIVAAEMYFIRAYGVRDTALLAGGLNLAAAASAAWLSTRITPRVEAPQPTPLARRAGPLDPPQWLAAAFLAGFCLLALEVVWFRLLVLFVKADSEAFPVMLAVVLAGIGLGGLSGGAWLRRVPDAYRFASPVAFASGLVCVISYAEFPQVIEPLGLSSIVQARSILQIGVPLMFPLSLLSGIFFTLLGAALRSHLASETETTGVLTLANTTGAALGSLVAGFALLPLLGIERSFFVVAVLYAGIGLLLLTCTPPRRRVAWVSAAACASAVVLFPFGGFYRAFAPSATPDFTPLVEGLGTRWVMPAIAFKAYACGTMTQPFIDCAITLAADGVRPEEITEIICEVAEGTVHRLWEPLADKQRPPTPYAAKFSSPFCMAVGFFDRKAGFAQFTEARIRDSSVLALASKIRYVINPADEYPRNFTGHLRAKTIDGREREFRQPHMRGGAHAPLSTGELELKFTDNTVYGGWSRTSADSLLDVCKDLFSRAEQARPLQTPSRVGADLGRPVDLREFRS